MPILSLKSAVNFVLIIVVCALLIPLEYKAVRFSAIIYPAIWLLLGYMIIRLRRNKKYQHSRVKLTIALGIFILITCFLLFRMVFCAYSSSSVAYINKKDRSTTIFCRSYDCFLTSGPCDLYKSRTVFGDLRWVTRIPGASIDTIDWEKAR